MQLRRMRPSELRGPRLRLLLGPRSSSSERLKQVRVVRCPGGPKCSEHPERPERGQCPRRRSKVEQP
eukprot:3952784-Alexandrium_andersonii.AAC.1